MEKYHCPLDGFPKEIKDSLPQAASTLIKELKGWVLGGKKCQVVFWEVEKSFVAEPHSHPHAEWGIVVNGWCKLTIEGETKMYNKGEEFYISPGAEHSAVMSDKYRAIDFFASPNWIKAERTAS